MEAHRSRYQRSVTRCESKAAVRYRFQALWVWCRQSPHTAPRRHGLRRATAVAGSRRRPGPGPPPWRWSPWGFGLAPTPDTTTRCHNSIQLRQSCARVLSQSRRDTKRPCLSSPGAGVRGKAHVRSAPALTHMGCRSQSCSSPYAVWPRPSPGRGLFSAGGPPIAASGFAGDVIWSSAYPVTFRSTRKRKPHPIWAVMVLVACPTRLHAPL